MSEAGDMPEPGATAPDRARRRIEGEFLLAVRRAGAVMQLLGAASAERIGINVTDLNCLNILALQGHMTAGDLARVTGLTTASITGVIDRLDAARGMRDVAPVFAPVIAAWRNVAARYTDDELRLILGFQEQLEQIMRDRLVELRGGGQDG